LAKPIGMQDFDRARQRKNDEMPITKHPEYAMYLSTRDMARNVNGPYQGAYTAIGANGQYITVLPAMELVLVHKVDFDEDGSRHISSSEFHTILQMVIESDCSGVCK